MLPFAHIGITLALFYIVTRGRNINYWYVIIGSMLPDIIDKVIGRVLFADTFASGRIFAHSLLFVVVLGLTVEFIGFIIILIFTATELRQRLRTS
ncbi:hypothetical protein EFE42_00600 [Methanohalophilus sp. RSK]|uniref:metal-dependent hydrolase n=1 Tax=Methanohalophilus sp. RSK TaxID=2485783 RepID=UPI000F43B80F|nr:metal-dependent hydrolase [Methanohalophilus sp. RSK]RNI15777.1 hypothetical protein EFE42_00600 [Methanohalophilus sp. RSK]